MQNNKKLIGVSILFVIVVILSIYAFSDRNKNIVEDTIENDNTYTENTDIINEDANLSVKNKNVTEENIKVDNKETDIIGKTDIILFYGDGCPHCAIVEKYISENNIDKKIKFEQKEVYFNKENSNQLVDKAKMCGIPTDLIGVPFLWDGEDCLVGDQDIIEFFKLKVSE